MDLMKNEKTTVVISPTINSEKLASANTKLNNSRKSFIKKTNIKLILLKENNPSLLPNIMNDDK